MQLLRFAKMVQHLVVIAFIGLVNKMFFFSCTAYGWLIVHHFFIKTGTVHTKKFLRLGWIRYLFYFIFMNDDRMCKKFRAIFNDVDIITLLCCLASIAENMEDL